MSGILKELASRLALETKLRGYLVPAVHFSHVISDQLRIENVFSILAAGTV